MNTPEEKIELLIKANQRLTNQLKELTEDFIKLRELTKEGLRNTNTRVKHLEELGNNQPMKCGSGYIKEVDFVIECKEVDWRSSKWKTYLLQLKGYTEVYEVFVNADVEIEPSSVLQFSVGEDGKLRSVKVKNW